MPHRPASQENVLEYRYLGVVQVGVVPMIFCRDSRVDKVDEPVLVVGLLAPPVRRNDVQTVGGCFNRLSRSAFEVRDGVNFREGLVKSLAYIVHVQR